MSSGSRSSSSTTSASNCSSVRSSTGDYIVERFDEGVLYEPQPVVDLPHERVDAAARLIVFGLDSEPAGDGQADVGAAPQPAECLCVVQRHTAGDTGTGQRADD